MRKSGEGTASGSPALPLRGGLLLSAVRPPPRNPSSGEPTEPVIRALGRCSTESNPKSLENDPKAFQDAVIIRREDKSNGPFHVKPASHGNRHIFMRSMEDFFRLNPCCAPFSQRT